MKPQNINYTQHNELLNTNSTYKVICFSNSHLPASDIEELKDRGEAFEYGMIMARDTGVVVKLYSEIESDEELIEKGLSDYYNNIVIAAYKAGYGMIEFDVDACEYKTFPIFEEGENTPIQDDLINETISEPVTHYFVKVDIKNDVQESIVSVIIKADSSDEAEKKALISQCYDTLGEGAELTEFGMTDLSGACEYKINDCTPILADQLDVLLNFF